MPKPRSRLAVAILATVATACTACSGGGGAADGPSPTTSASASVSPSASVSSSVSPSASASTSASASPSATASTPGGPAAAGPAVSGSGYRFHVPKGWRDVTSKLGRADVDRAAAADASVAGFRSNVNVVPVANQVAPGQLDIVVDGVRKKMLASAPSYAVLPRTVIGGTVAGHLGGIRTQGATRYWLEQFVLPDHARTLVISFSFSPKVPAASRARTIASVLVTWAWR